MGLVVAVSPSRLNTMQSCMTKYDLTYNQKWVSVTPPDYLEEGTLMHKMLAQYYKLKMHRSRWQQNKKTHADIVDICVRVGNHTAVSMVLDYDKVENVIKSFREYCTFYANDGWDNILFIEAPAAKVLYESNELTILVEGIIDLGIGLSNCPVMPVDFKTAKQKKYPEEMSNQFIAYCWMLGVHNIVVGKVGLQKTKQGADKFQRHTLSYTQDIIDEWVSDTIWWVRHYLELEKQDYYPKDRTSCDKYAGCIFKKVCMSDRLLREWKLRSRFEQRERKGFGGEL